MTQFRFRHPVEVRFRDLDLGGHAHHSQALVYFEEARTAYWREVAGRPDPGDVDYILAEATVRYRRRVLYPATLEVAVQVSVLGKKHFEMEYEVRDPDGELLISGSTVLVMYDYESEKTAAVPEALRRRIEEHEGGPLPRRRSRIN